MSPNRQHVVMVASENDALVGGKVGGVGDVVRSLPLALASAGWQVTVITPSYGFLHVRNSSSETGRVQFPFAGEDTEAEVWKAEPKEASAHITHLLIEHPLLRGNPIYFDDPPDSPFKRDSSKYALFCSAVGQLLKTFDPSFVLHLHDWHAATVLLLAHLHPAFSHLKSVRTVFTIHNLSLQGSRPIFKHESSVEHWFPELCKDSAWVADWKDARYEEPVYTPMVIGIQRADKVNTVSPTYAEEILKPSDQDTGYHGGEGLEVLLQRAQKEKRLFGILNGCEYPEHRLIRHIPFSGLSDLLFREAAEGGEKSGHTQVSDLDSRIEKFKASPPSAVLTSVTRIVEQKVGLLFERNGSGLTAIEEIMNILHRWNGVYIILGSGVTDCEQRIMEVSKKYERLLFIRAYAEKLSQALYANGTMFLMPSSFEPCGISQMLAMRDGQPCLVHAVGGLRDTVMNGVNGFAFYGATIREKVDNLVQVTQRALEIFHQNKPLWEKLKIEARKARFTWEKSARQYIELLYSS